jgi:5-formaminoimidazole-4-carboxamide-1-beta-D-ribofuranosyl 5'-monophosphate synthetase
MECFLSQAKNIKGYFYLVVPEAVREKATGLLREINEKDIHKSFVLTV